MCYAAARKNWLSAKAFCFRLLGVGRCCLCWSDWQYYAATCVDGHAFEIAAAVGFAVAFRNPRWFLVRPVVLSGWSTRLYEGCSPSTWRCTGLPWWRSGRQAEFVYWLFAEFHSVLRRHDRQTRVLALAVSCRKGRGLDKAISHSLHITLSHIHEVPTHLQTFASSSCTSALVLGQPPISLVAR